MPSMIEAAYSRGIADRVTGRSFNRDIPVSIPEGLHRQYMASYREGFMQADSASKMPLRRAGAPRTGATEPLFKPENAVRDRNILNAIATMLPKSAPPAYPPTYAPPPVPPPPAQASVAQVLKNNWGLVLFGTIAVAGGAVAVSRMSKAKAPATSAKAA